MVVFSAALAAASCVTIAVPIPIVSQPASLASSCRGLETDAPNAAVSWFGPDSPKQRARIDEWCRTIGAVIVSSTPTSQPAPRLDGGFVVLTWNSNVGQGDLRRLVDDLRTGRLAGTRVAEFALLVQEARRTGSGIPPVPAHAAVPKRLGDDAGFEIQSIARSLHLNLVYAPAMRNGPGLEDRGNAILSTLPLDEATVIELPIERQRRIAIAATAHAAGTDGTPWTMRLVSVHLETRAGALRRGPTSARRRQAEFLVQALGATSIPTIVAGDFNTSWGDDEPAVKTLRRAYPDAPPTGGTTWSRGLMSAKLDHVFAFVPNADVDLRRARDRYGSDHFPLIAVFRNSS